MVVEKAGKFAFYGAISTQQTERPKEYKCKLSYRIGDQVAYLE